MTRQEDRFAGIRLEGSCGPQAEDWVRSAPAQQGLERIAARFAGHAYDPHRHDTYALGLTLWGVQRFDYRGAEHNSLAGDLIVLHPDEVHNGRSGAEPGFEYRMAYIAPSLILAALEGRARALPFVRGAVLRDAALAAALRPLVAALDRPLEPLAVDQTVQAIADALLALDPSAGSGGTGAASLRAVERGRDFLAAHHTRVVTAQELEAVTGLSRYAFARQFRRLLGTSPYRFLTMRRLDEARRRLAAGEPLAAVAAECGFADQSHMTRQFKLAFGIPPGRWRALQAPRL